MQGDLRHRSQPSRHRLRTWPKYFHALWDGSKTFEIRYDDRGYKVGDLLRLEEWNPHTKGYSGRWIEAYVGYVVAAPGVVTDVAMEHSRESLGAGWVVMAIHEVARGEGLDGF